MAYLHCHNCDWSQDDFWSKEGGYNPIDHLKHYREDILEDRIHFDKYAIEEMGLDPKEDEKGWYINGQAYVANRLRATAESIERMYARTYEEWKQTKDTFICPECGSKNLDID